jgi:diphthamide biosynthesis protein 2
MTAPLAPLPLDIPSLPAGAQVTVQLPDHLLCYTRLLSEQIPNATIVGDSTFGSCCVDMVTTNHVKTDLILKVGDSCLSTPSSSSIPILYVFEKQELDVEALSVALLEFINQQSGYVVLLSSTRCYHVLEALPPHTRLIKTHIYTEYPFVSKHSQSIQGRYYDIPLDNESPLAYFYVGDPDSLECSSILMRLSTAQCMIFDPNDSSTLVPKHSAGLMKRFFMVQQAKEAQTVGIVVGTLSVGMYIDLL